MGKTLTIVLVGILGVGVLALLVLALRPRKKSTTERLLDFAEGDTGQLIIGALT
jgi:hypothetical protein